MNFTDTQNKAYESFLNGENMFITGPGGCGKSYFIKNIYDIALKEGKNIKVTSLTGCSAILLNCKATTIHKWGCLGLGKGDELTMYRKIMKKNMTSSYLETEILIIDEISMLNQYLFEMIDYLCKRIRNCDEPFGGIQLIASGDFYQLPPIGDNDNSSQSNFCFQSPIWQESFNHHFVFDVNFRQNDDPEYFEILQEIREGSPSFDTIGTLVSCMNKKYDHKKSRPTQIYPIKKMVEKINKIELDKLLKTTESQEYKSCINYDNNPITINNIASNEIKGEIDNNMKNGMFENKLVLCVGCQVMCISNINQEIGLVNGSQGIVKCFRLENNKYYPVVKFDNIPYEMLIKEHGWLLENNAKYTINQLPLILSWAITIHKSQGMSIDNAIIDIGNSVFQYGQTYVALSRVKSLNGLYLTKVNANKIKAHPEVKKFYNKIETM
tara:strand:- start:32921 stop:34237 length:1317 start_codon:yes stop_codon:yes gene_type:complete